MPEVKKKILFITLITVGIWFVLCCWPFLALLKAIGLQESGETVLWEDGGVYAINSQILLQDIQQGRENIFEFLPDGELIVSPDPGLPPVRWTSKDYFLIADQFNETISDETLNAWQFQNMSFSMDCKYFSDGFQQAIFYVVQFKSPNTRVERSIWIYPLQDRIEWRERAYENEFGYEAFELSQINISPEEAIKIAEYQGGSAFRVSEENNCRIGLRERFLSQFLANFNMRRMLAI